MRGRHPEVRESTFVLLCQILNELARKERVGYGGGDGAKLLERALLSQLPSWASVSVPSREDLLWL